MQHGPMSFRAASSIVPVKGFSIVPGTPRVSFSSCSYRSYSRKQLRTTSILVCVVHCASIPISQLDTTKKGKEKSRRTVIPLRRSSQTGRTPCGSGAATLIEAKRFRI